MSIKFVTVSKNDKDYRKVVDLYKKAFPKKERFPLWLLFYKVKSKNAQFSSLYENDNWLGFLYTIEHKNIVLILYLAISETCRSGGYGTKVLTAIREKSVGKRIVLDIEEVDEKAQNYVQRFRRKRFYEKNDYRSSGYTINEMGQKFEVLILGDSMTKPALKEVYKHLAGNFLGLFFLPEIEGTAKKTISENNKSLLCLGTENGV